MPRAKSKNRGGVPTFFTLDHDAHALLRAMIPNSKGVGRVLSELIRKEAERRTDRPKMLAELAAQAAARE